MHDELDLLHVNFIRILLKFKVVPHHRERRINL